MKTKVKTIRTYKSTMTEAEVTAIHAALRIVEAFASGRAFEIDKQDYSEFRTMWTDLRLDFHEALRTPDNGAVAL